MTIIDDIDVNAWGGGAAALLALLIFIGGIFGIVNQVTDADTERTREKAAVCRELESDPERLLCLEKL